ncbi:MAG: hypothetical protein CSA33_07625 [Desulfobulbus propionicus]|nr:MAG: hypothetical protein CSA33_07625 [Desulfobulbus propionicus]
MNTSGSLHPTSDKMKKVLSWVSEMLETHPEMTRSALLQKAELQFDLSPADCLFLDKNFTDPPPSGGENA